MSADHRPLLAAALDYAARGWPVLPLRARDKRPATATGLHDATLDRETITAWWSRWPSANIGLRTGVAFDVLDLDNDQALDELDAAAPPDAGPIEGPIVATGKGAHIYVGVTGAGNRAGLLPGVDWRGTGGYVVAPPSTHPSGAIYTWGDREGYGPDHPIEPCPPWLAAIVKRDAGLSLRAIASATGASYGTVHEDVAGDRNRSPDDEPKMVTGQDGKTYNATKPKPAHRWAQVALDAETGRVALAGEGTRNHTLNAAAFSLGQIVAGGGLDPYDVAGRLLVAAQRCGLTEHEAVATIASGLRAGARTPRTAS